MPFTNHLANETSPYLKQHAHNPVDWYPWGPEALQKAREQDRPIFLSIGYSACHWCHVMEHESFENPEVAALLNEHFVSIKVDREERPDLDQIYMTAVQLMTGQGGWPMSMFLTPDLQPFFGGTYFPPENKYGRTGFKDVLQALIDAWQNRRGEINEVAQQRTGQLQAFGQIAPSDGDLKPELLRNAATSLARSFDARFGGFGQAPKFPHPMELRLLLRTWQRFGADDDLAMVRQTLDHMAMGGIYDHLGGGFHRYSTDERWLVPHFEKMLYDNALLTSTYVEAFLATKEPLYREVVQETLDYVLREMTSPEGPFYSTLDADSEGVEGKFYIWSVEEIERLLGKEETELLATVYDVNLEGNWEGHNILHRVKTYSQYARLLGLEESAMRKRLADAKKKLFEVRGQRVRPARDEKTLTSWNALMIGALAQAAHVLEDERYSQTACKAADFILKRMRTPDGRLLRTYSSGSEPKLNGYLEDYSFLIDALVTLYETTFEPRWIESALDLAHVMIEQFWDVESGGFFYTGRDHEPLITRSKEPHDNAIPSGNSMAVIALLRLFELTSRAELREKAETTLKLFRGLMAEHPMAVGQMLIGLDFDLGPTRAYAIVGDLSNAETKQVLHILRQRFEPRRVVALKSIARPPAQLEETLPLLRNRPAKGAVTTYVCENFTCREPIVGTARLESDPH
jgi:uncharacterized protein YyaL (SSP411 family)